jgi:hypothetical protein
MLRPRHTLYPAEEARALDTIRDIFEINAQLLRAAREVELDHWVESGALKISPASIDRVRAQ